MESFLSRAEVPHVLVGELPDRAVNRPPLALFVDPPRKADGQFGIPKELFPVPGALDLRGEPLVAVQDGDISPLPDAILAEEDVGGVHGGAKALEDPLDPVPPGRALQKSLGGKRHGLQDGGPFFQDLLCVLPECDVPAHGLVFQDVSAFVEKGPVGPLIPEDVAEDGHDAIFEGIDGVLRPEILQAGIDLFTVRLGNGQKNVAAAQFLFLNAEVAAIGFVDIGQGAVGAKTADQLRLVRLSCIVRMIAPEVSMRGWRA